MSAFYIMSMLSRFYQREIDNNNNTLPPIISTRFCFSPTLVFMLSKFPSDKTERGREREGDRKKNIEPAEDGIV